MNDGPLLHSDSDRLNQVRSWLDHATLQAVHYHQAASGGHRDVPAGLCHEIDLELVLELTHGIVIVTWERDNLVEGISIVRAETLGTIPDIHRLSALGSQQWAPAIGSEIVSLAFGWQLSDPDRSESLWSIRLNFATGMVVVVALGEISASGKPSYYPDSLVAIFDEKLARSYKHAEARSSSWGDDE